MIRTIQQTTKAVIIFIMINYMGQPHNLYAASKKEIKISYHAKNVSCFGNADGFINLEIKGGKPPYAIKWNDGSDALQLKEIPSGNYVVRITDAAGMEASQSINITEPYPLMVHAQAVAENCNARDAKIAIEVTGGQQPYQYEWSNATRLKNLENVAAGDYDVRITDANGCLKISHQSVERKKQLAVSVARFNPVCNNEASGLIDVEVKGGFAPYSFLWSNGATTEDLSGLAAGNYSVTVKDNNGCSAISSVELVNPAPLKINATIQDADVDKTNGSISLHITGGNGKYSYIWSNMASSSDLFNLEEGMYAVRVSDANQCMAADYFTVKEKSALQVASVVKHVLCNGQSTGSVQLNVHGGKAPYTASWSNGMNGTMVSQLIAGDYTALITDANGLKTSATFTIHQPDATGIFATVQDESAKGYADGKIKLEVMGVAPYTYVWSNGKHDALITQLKPGNYTVLIKDGNGCELMHEVLVSTETGMSNADKMMRNSELSKEIANSIDVFPNPFENNFTIRFASPINNIQKVELCAADGRIMKLLTTNYTNKNVKEIAVSAPALVKGSYLVRVTAADSIYSKIIMKE
jgi:hypothetical protein